MYDIDDAQRAWFLYAKTLGEPMALASNGWEETTDPRLFVYRDIDGDIEFKVEFQDGEGNAKVKFRNGDIGDISIWGDDKESEDGE
jgi:hypothetical protein